MAALLCIGGGSFIGMIGLMFWCDRGRGYNFMDMDDGSEYEDHESIYQRTRTDK